jgi:eukaryotic-like serine/threonine-protein kinase
VVRVTTKPHESFGPYMLYAPIARGGMATVHAARLVGAEGFSRLVAAKRLHPELAEDPDFVAMLLDEARIASKIHHPNVVPVLDVVVSGSELVIVQDYVHGVALHTLMKVATLRDAPFPVSVMVAIVGGVLAGLQAAHEATDEMGVHLGIVHRDVSPQNVMLTVEGVPRLLDFGIAKARNRIQLTRPGLLKGKLGYMAPEQLRMEPITRRVDLYAMGVLLWELLVNRRLYTRDNEATFVKTVLAGQVESVSAALEPPTSPAEEQRRRELLALEPIVSRAMARAPEDRYDSAAEMLDAMLRVCPAATSVEVARWVQTLGTEDIDRRQRMLAANEESWRSSSKMTFASSTQPSSLRNVLVPATADAVPAISLAPERPIAPPPARRVPRGVHLLPIHLLPAVVVGAALAAVLLELVHAPSAPTGSAAGGASSAVTIAPVAAAPPPPHAMRPSHAATPATPSPSPASAPPADSASVDCNPPFYFYGSRKVFKAGCL